MGAPVYVEVEDIVGDFLEHYGVKGMKWGVRKSSGGDVSDDAKTVKKYKKRVKSGGTKTLTNKELQDLVNRLNLEQQYSKLNENKTAFGKIKKGQEKAKVIMGIAKTLQEIHTFANSQLVKDIRKALS